MTVSESIRTDQIIARFHLHDEALEQKSHEIARLASLLEELALTVGRSAILTRDTIRLNQREHLGLWLAILALVISNVALVVTR